MIALFASIGAVLLIAASSIWRGYVLTILWSWFAVPAFHAPHLQITQAIGVSLLAGFLTHQTTKESPSWPITLSMALLAPGAALLVGWVVTLFM